ncbi:MAG: site-2 protease family protein [Patescibacteria group bacterium]
MDIFGAILSIGVLVYSSVLHEIAHGYVAYRLGDPTAKLQGRLTLNPLKHIDWYMSVLLPVVLYLSTGGRFIFGGAKPVPVDSFNLRDGIKDLALVSLVGPLTNISLAVIASIFIHLFYPDVPFMLVGSNDIIGFILTKTVEWNLVLAIFNLVPIPPLDGSKIFALLLPKREAAIYLSMGTFGMVILMVLLFFPIGGFSLMGLVSTLIGFALSILGF